MNEVARPTDPNAEADAAQAYNRIAFVASEAPDAQQARAMLVARYGEEPVEDADIVVALGGDGFMLQTLHRFRDSGIPIYGMNRGSVGFLMNSFRQDDLPTRIAAAQRVVIHPLMMEATDVNGRLHRAPAINEVSLIRQSYQASKLRIAIDGKMRMEELICDGVLVATPAGSTAYNLSAQGPILPIGTPLLAVTPISAFRPRRWRGALVPDRARVDIAVLESEKRPVNATADHFQVLNVVAVRARLDPASSMTMLVDRDHSMEERILREQFG
ncbi:NAD kinase [Ancylobacter sp. SL191]|jgi:NAD+ kinase|uniref:NAD kinase n=1 Tax=Ancylobacter sp. SL191 TaxID=2995166 RepID=UPI00226F5134|nr:NAD kinase [Ancylobacter sp. SL191]WAC26777.1 NAD kinase [Ancylobacter sp. SL191]